MLRDPDKPDVGWEDSEKELGDNPRALSTRRGKPYYSNATTPNSAVKKSDAMPSNIPMLPGDSTLPARKNHDQSMQIRSLPSRPLADGGLP